MENIKNKIVPIIMGILILMIIGEGYLLTRQSNANLKNDKTIVKRDEQRIKKLATSDTALSHRIRVLKDSIEYHRKRADYWKSKYISPSKITKQEVKDIFKEDSITIASRVIKGSECDSLQREQSLTIGLFNRENNKLDSLIKVKNSSIFYLTKIDSINGNIQKSLEKKIRNRTLGEIGLGLLALLAIIFH